MTKWVYSFGSAGAEGGADRRNLLGGKGANLAEMSNLGLPVPPGFTITTQVCGHYYANGEAYPAGLRDEVTVALRALEQALATNFGDRDNPLLVAVRSGARVSMPGMMDTVLNLGLNDETVRGLSARSNDERFAYDSYRRFIQMYGDVVLGIDHYNFEEVLSRHKEAVGVTLDTELSADDWKEVVAAYKEIVETEFGHPFPQDPQEQLWGAIGAVFSSWMTQRAITYRRLHRIPGDWGTAVNVQAMVFGNMGDDCATGVGFTRDPSTGENVFYGEYLENAQGEDVVAGIRTPQPLTRNGQQGGSGDPSMEERLPDIYRELLDIRNVLEIHYKDMQDIEFTVQKGRLFMLQTRSGKRTAAAAVRIAVEMAEAGSISQEDAVQRVDPAQLDQLLHPTLDPDAEKVLLARGLPASPGAAHGKIVLTADKAERWAGEGQRVILVRTETSPEDIHGMHAAAGILTSRGGMTSHAAVVARGMGRPCVAGMADLSIDLASATVQVGGHALREGDVITIDGAAGEAMLGEVPTRQPELSEHFGTLMGWADGMRRLRVRANAETPNDVRTALAFGAEGIGLCRTEHMFFDPQRLVAVRRMILAEDVDGRRAALAELLPHQRDDFVEIFKIMGGRPVTIRLLDPPLHEFLPHSEEEIADVAASSGLTPEVVRRRTLRLSESNPMLGHRGCRLGITAPEIYEMQARAIFEAALLAGGEGDPLAVLEIMVPLVATRAELDLIKERIDHVARAVAAEKGARVGYVVGTMIELPRAALCADQIAESAAFFSFGTNGLTQTTFGISRDDAGSFLGEYERVGIVPNDPFVSIDIDGVGALVSMAVEKGRASRPDIKLGICGEHGGDPESIAFFERVGLDYVSCSPYRVPIARLAAAQAVLAS